MHISLHLLSAAAVTTESTTVPRVLPRPTYLLAQPVHFLIILLSCPILVSLCPHPQLLPTMMYHSQTPLPTTMTMYPNPQLPTTPATACKRMGNQLLNAGSNSAPPIDGTYRRVGKRKHHWFMFIFVAHHLFWSFLSAHLISHMYACVTVVDNKEYWSLFVIQCKISYN